MATNLDKWRKVLVQLRESYRDSLLFFYLYCKAFLAISNRFLFTLSKDDCLEFAD